MQGTLGYMPPETFEPADDAAGRTAVSGSAWDCYSLAVLLWAMWARAPPWERCTPAKVVGMVARGRRPKMPEPGSARAPPSELRALVVAM